MNPPQRNWIRDTGRVGDELPDRDTRPVGQQRAQVSSNRFVKPDSPCLNQLQHGDGSDGLVHGIHHYGDRAINGNPTANVRPPAGMFE
jgi:hypothetical protein